jgi:hypothetical protein
MIAAGSPPQADLRPLGIVMNKQLSPLSLTLTIFADLITML